MAGVQPAGGAAAAASSVAVSGTSQGFAAEVAATPQGAVSQQVSSLVARFEDMPRAELLGALLIAMLLSKSDEEQGKDSATALFAALALAGAWRQGDFSFSLDASFGGAVGGVAEAYASGGAGTGTGGAVNFSA